ncbi:MAG TPA: PhzF family phenazine biosynthesis protein [Pyrinomonadaceae bacterium]|jgi:PhzF family phenazine biosynthesis protein
MKSYSYKVFTKNKNGGNPAVVVFGDGFNVEDLEKKARSIDAYLTVFILPEESRPDSVRLRFFGRKGEMDFCGHGILAAGYTYAQKSGKSDFLFETNVKTVALTVSNDSLVQFLTEKIDLSEEPSINKDDILHRFGINPRVIDFSSPFSVASIGSPKLLVPIIDLQSLWHLEFDLAALEKWSAETKVNGAYFYCLETVNKDSLAHARGFNPLLSKSEDAGTGVAAGALVELLKGKSSAGSGDYVIEQGDVVGAKCEVYVSLRQDYIKVGGFVTPA